MEQFINELAALHPLWIYAVAGAIAYVENIFPPLPSDVILVAAGSLAGLGRVDYSILLIISTAGSTAGFMTMYKIGEWFGLRILETGKFKFIPLGQIHKVEKWFTLYGYWIVVVNRFLAGTRAVIAFFTGISELAFWRTTILSLFSSLLWNAFLLFAGKELGMNWREILSILETYGRIVTVVILILIILLAGRSILKSRNASSKKSTIP